MIIGYSEDSYHLPEEYMRMVTVKCNPNRLDELVKVESIIAIVRSLDNGKFIRYRFKINNN